MQTSITQVVQPLPRSWSFWEHIFDQPIRFQYVHMAIDCGTAGPTRDTHHQVVGTLQGIVQQPVHEPPIDISKRRAYLSKCLNSELTSCPTSFLRRLRHHKRHFPRLLLRVIVRLYALPGTLNAGAAVPLPPASYCDRRYRASCDVVRSLPLLLH